MAKIIWSPKAKKNLNSIYGFIAQDSALQAFRVAKEIVDQVGRLSEHPGKGKIVPEINSAAVREIKVFSYRVIYKIASNDEVLIAKIWHDARLLKKS